MTRKEIRKIILYPFLLGIFSLFCFSLTNSDSVPYIWRYQLAVGVIVTSGMLNYMDLVNKTLMSVSIVLSMFSVTTWALILTCLEAVRVGSGGLQIENFDSLPSLNNFAIFWFIAILAHAVLFCIRLLFKKLLEWMFMPDSRDKEEIL